MLDFVAAREAFRLRVAGVVVSTTGIINDLSATSLGFARASGSFLTDGFAAGMEVVGTGFSSANNAPKMIQSVTTGFLTITGGAVAQSAAAGRSLSVGIPQDRRWENTATPGTTTPGTRPYISDQWGSALAQFLASPVEGGHLEETGTYYITWYGFANTGILALYREIAAVKALFTPGTKVAVGGLYLRVPASGPVTGQLTPLDNGMAYIQLAIPWRCASINSVAA